MFVQSTVQRVARGVPDQDNDAKEPSLQQDGGGRRGGGGVEEAGENVPMQQLIQQVTSETCGSSA